MGDVDYNSLKEELGTCKYFLVDSGVENGRQSLQLCQGYSGPEISVEKLDVVFDSLKCLYRRLDKNQ